MDALLVHAKLMTVLACFELTPKAEVGGVFMRRVSEGLSVRRAGRGFYGNSAFD